MYQILENGGTCREEMGVGYVRMIRKDTGVEIRMHWNMKTILNGMPFPPSIAYRAPVWSSIPPSASPIPIWAVTRTCFSRPIAPFLWSRDGKISASRSVGRHRAVGRGANEKTGSPEVGWD